MIRPSPRLRRVLLIARRSRLWTAETRRYMTEINAVPCEGCGLRFPHHAPGCVPEGDVDDCAF
jgi:hypothetical protein